MGQNKEQQRALSVLADIRECYPNTLRKSNLSKLPTSLDSKSDWAYYLPSHYNVALGFRLNTLQKKLKQVSLFSFGTGDIIYDHKINTGDDWGNQLKYIKTYIQIEKASQDQTLKTGTTSKRLPGEVKFSLYKINNGKKCAEKLYTNTVKQHQFVEFLITAELTETEIEWTEDK